MKKSCNIFIVACSALLLTACNTVKTETASLRHQFSDILDISYTPDSTSRCSGWFTDAGSWMGFTIPEKTKWVNGFCGPFSLDMERREWMAKSAVTVTCEGENASTFIPDSINYYPGELYMKSHARENVITQTLHFIDDTTTLLSVNARTSTPLLFTGDEWNKNVTVEVDQNSVIAKDKSGEIIVLTFNPDIEVRQFGNNYKAIFSGNVKETRIAISFLTSDKELKVVQEKCEAILLNANEALQNNEKRWDGYLSNVLRNDMKTEYDRIAAKAVVTLISNWRTSRGGLLHEGVVPSHAVNYFIGFWAWDSWRFSAAMSSFAPELAKDNIRAMFDYQQPDGMIIDCIYTDPSENNMRDSKPPLVSWAVDEIFTNTKDTLFLGEMYPQLLSYYNWWYNKRDHDRNGICEYGSTDGTLEAAAWESGMDNAIRFDNAKMVKNEGYDDAWSFDQESVDLNSYLALECRLLKKFAGILNVEFKAPDYSSKVAGYFFDNRKKFFFDRHLKDGSFIEEAGCEAYIPLWTGIASEEQVKEMMPILTDSTKFSTYIPFPTIAADNPKYDARGYWRGPIWLDQTYFAIKGLRNYGYRELADKYTKEVFERLQGLKENEPINENYDTHTGIRLKAPHFSWSSAHLLMLYHDLGR